MIRPRLDEACPQCRRGYTKRDSTHAKGCPSRWLSFGESVDEMLVEQQLCVYEDTKAEGQTFEEWKAGLHRPKRRAR